MTLQYSSVRSVPVIHRETGLFLFASMLLLSIFSLSIVPALLSVASLLYLRHHWSAYDRPVLRALSFQAIAFLGAAGVLAISPSCANGALLALMIMNLLAVALGRTPKSS